MTTMIELADAALLREIASAHFMPDDEVIREGDANYYRVTSTTAARLRALASVLDGLPRPIR